MLVYVLIIVCCILYGLDLLISKEEITFINIYGKGIAGMLPNDITSLLCLCKRNYSTRSPIGIKLEVPWVHSEHGKLSFSYCAPWLWNELKVITPLETVPS